MLRLSAQEPCPVAFPRFPTWQRRMPAVAAGVLGRAGRATSTAWTWAGWPAARSSRPSGERSRVRGHVHDVLIRRHAPGGGWAQVALTDAHAPHRAGVGAATMLDLQAQLYQQQEEAKARQEAGLAPLAAEARVRRGALQLQGGKALKGRNAGVDARNARDMQQHKVNGKLVARPAPSGRPGRLMLVRVSYAHPSRPRAASPSCADGRHPHLRSLRGSGAQGRHLRQAG